MSRLTSGGGNVKIPRGPRPEGLSGIDTAVAPVSITANSAWRVRLFGQDAALSRPKDGFDSRTRYHCRSTACVKVQEKCRKIKSLLTVFEG